MQSYKDLEIYKLAHKLAIEMHELSLKLPGFEKYEEASQIRRASKSIAANIVEGFGRRKYKQDYIRFLIFAHSSCDETREHLEFLFETGSLDDEKIFSKLNEELTRLSRMISNFIKAVKK
ncbi:MAG: four helix bundle protein [Candidatus Omnitrophica bacterium]|nr:four helix bundle protein [Candidatus Omnitrophota bacterium]MBU1924985.1 four helix bundle protein [Candidatus Omnitrophota bacterium]